MPEALKILGQASPGAGGTSDLCDPGAGETQVISLIEVCNTGAAATTFRIYPRKAGAAVAVGTASFYDAPIGAKETVQIRGGYTLSGADVLTVGAAAAGVTFTAHGSSLT